MVAAVHSPECTAKLLVVGSIRRSGSSNPSEQMQFPAIICTVSMQIAKLKRRASSRRAGLARSNPSRDRRRIKMISQKTPMRTTIPTLVWLLCGFVFAHGPTSLHAFQRNRGIAISPEGSLLPAPREVETLLEEAASGIEGKQWSEASYSLGLLLGIEEALQNDMLGVDYFLFDESDVTAAPGSVFKKALHLIDQMPEEGRKVIELRYGVQAGQLLEKGVNAGDWEEIKSVSGRFGFTSAGQDATLILAERALRGGEPRLASMLFKRLLEQQSALVRFGPQLGIWTAAAFESSGMKEQAIEAIELTRMQFASAKVEWNSDTIAWNGRDKTSAQVIQSIKLGATSQNQRSVKHPAYPGGNPSRNAESNAGSPLPFLKWHAELHESLQHKANLDKTLRSKLSDTKSTVIPSRYPISVDPWIITFTYDQRIVAIDRHTGRVGWECVYSGMPLGFSLDRFDVRDNFSSNSAAPDYLTRRVWGETMMGQIASDGRRLFSVSEMPSIEVAGSYASGLNNRVLRSNGPKSFNVLQCWSIPDQGKLVWEVGGQFSETEKELAGALFLGAPLPMDNELLILAEFNGEVYLVGLNPRDGHLRWKQPIAANNQATIAGDSMRRNLGASPAVDGSIAVCPTLSGYLVAYDLITHSLRWVHRYEFQLSSATANQVNMFGNSQYGEFPPFTSRSSETSVLIHDGVVLFAPPDGSGVTALAIETGEVLWGVPGEKVAQVRYVAGAWNGAAVIVEQSNVIAYDMRSGVRKWTLSLSGLLSGAQVVGRGVRNRSNYYLPLSNQEIVQIDLNRGEITDKVRVEKPLGNLVCVNDRIICASPFELDCYAVREAFQSQTKDELQRDSVSPQGLAHLGELALATGDIGQSLDLLERANSLDPENPEISLLLVKAGAEALHRDFERYVDRVSKYEQFSHGIDRLPYLRMLVRGLQKQGRYEEIVAKLFILSDNRTGTRRIDQLAGNSFVDQSAQWSIQEDRWLQTEFARTLAKLAPDARERVSKSLVARLESIQKLPQIVRRLKLYHLTAFDETEAMRMKEVDDMIRLRDFIHAERMLLSDGRLESAPREAQWAIKRRERLATIYIQTHRPLMALDYLGGDIERFKDLGARINKESRGSEQIEISLPNVSSTEGKPHRWPTGKAEVLASTARVELQAPLQARNGISESSTPCRWQDRVGEAMNGWDVYASNFNIELQHPKTNDFLQLYLEIGHQDRVGDARIYGIDGVVLLELNRQIIAIDTMALVENLQDGPMWRYPYPDSSSESEPSRTPRIQNEKNQWGIYNPKNAARIVGVSRSSVVVHSQDELFGLDPYSGLQLWRVSGFRDAFFTKDGEQLIAHLPSKQSIVHVDLRDGFKTREIALEPAKWQGWTAIGAVGARILMSSDNANLRTLRMLNGRDGSIEQDREFAEGTKGATEPTSGFVILQTDGSVFYWQAESGKEFTSKVPAEGNPQSISVQRFGDSLLVLPHVVAFELENFRVSPNANDQAYAMCAGRLFALSVVDGTPLWKHALLVREYGFPLHQSRESPAAFFVRMVSPARVAKLMDFASIAMIDVATGRPLYQSDELEAVRGLGFRQRLLPEENTIHVEYLGVKWDATWTQNAWPVDLEEPAPIGLLDPAEVKARIDAIVKGKRAKLDKQSNLNDPLPPESP